VTQTILKAAWRLVVPARIADSRLRSGAGALLLLISAFSLAAPAAKAARPPQDAPRLAIRANSSFAIGDFDSDRKPDLATAEIAGRDSHATRYLIRFQLTSGVAESIGVTGAFGVPEISALDVNGDHVPDLVVTAAGQPRPIAILLNDGHGQFVLANPADFAVPALDAPVHWTSSRPTV
jgi:hypothetical protein